MSNGSRLGARACHRKIEWEMILGWVFLCFFSLSTLALGHECQGLLHTLLGPTGVSTFSLDARGRFGVWRDHFTVDGINWNPDFHIELDSVRPSNLAGIQSFSALAPAGRGARLGLVNDSSGGLMLILHNKRMVPIHIPQLEAPSASTLVSPSLFRHYRMAVSSTAGMLAMQSSNILERKVIRDLVRENYQLESSLAFVASGNSLYRLKIESQFLHPTHDEDLAAALKIGPVEIIQPNTIESGLDSLQIQNQPMVDLSPRATRLQVLVPSGDPDRAFSIGQPEKVMEFTDSHVMNGIDRVKVIGKSTAVVSSEIGQVAMVDLKLGAITQSLSLDKPGWIRDLSAHRTKDETVVWAISAADGKIYHWSSKSLTRFLVPFEEQLPDGVTPMAVSSLGLGIPEGYFSQSEQLGFFSNFKFNQSTAEIERTVVLGSDGKLYGWTMPDLSNPEFHWVTHHFVDETGSASSETED